MSQCTTARQTALLRTQHGDSDTENDGKQHGGGGRAADIVAIDRKSRTGVSIVGDGGARMAGRRALARWTLKRVMAT